MAFNLKYVAVGGGRHSFYLGHQQATEATKWSTVAQLPYILTSCLTKVSICLMIIRLTNSRRMTQAMWTFVGFLVVINLACFIVVTASCRPFQALWDFSIHGKCRSHTILFAFAWIQGGKFDPPLFWQRTNTLYKGFSIATDLLCTILPILVLWNVKITFRQKIAICGVMSLGLLWVRIPKCWLKESDPYPIAQPYVVSLRTSFIPISRPSPTQLVSKSSYQTTWKLKTAK